MNCAIYKGRRKPDTYLYVTGIDEFDQLPAGLLQMMGELTLVMELQLDHERTLAQADVKEVMAQLSDRGYFIQMPPGDGRPHPLDA